MFCDVVLGIFMCGPRKFIRGVLLKYFTEGCTDLTRKAIGRSMLHPIASRAGSLPVFLRKSIATCDYPGWRGGLNPLSTLWIHAYFIFQAGSLPVFLRKPLATCDFPGRVWTPCPPSGFTHGILFSMAITLLRK